MFVVLQCTGKIICCANEQGDLHYKKKNKPQDIHFNENWWIKDYDNKYQTREVYNGPCPAEFIPPKFFGQKWFLNEIIKKCINQA